MIIDNRHVAKDNITRAMKQSARIHRSRISVYAQYRLALSKGHPSLALYERWLKIKGNQEKG